MLTPLRLKLAGGEVLVGDGAMGTRLLEHGLPEGGCPEQYVLDHPNVIRSIHAEYFAAGADLATTDTFGANPVRLEPHGLAGDYVRINRRGAELARAAAPPGRFVAGAIGPTGLLFAPLGPLTVDEAFRMFSIQAEALAEGGADILFIETMASIEEAEVAICAAQVTGLPIAAAMTFERSPEGELATHSGARLEQVAERLMAAGADVIGSNCGCGFGQMVEVIERLRPLTRLPILAQANAGPSETPAGRQWQDTPSTIADHVQHMLEAGVSIIGGCCGTGPDHIQMIRQVVDQNQSSRRLMPPQ